MATGYAKATGRLGVCLATSGPGGIHLLNGLYDAKLDHVPVLAITGMQETSVLGTGYQQEVHLDQLLRRRGRVQPDGRQPGPAARRWSTSRSAPRCARRGVAHLTFPTTSRSPTPTPTRSQHVAPARPPATAPVYLAAAGLPGRRRTCSAAADVLNAGRRSRSWPGAGALHARDEVLAVADTLGAPVIKTLPGKAVVPDDSPYTTGGIGLLGTAARRGPGRGLRHAAHGRHELPLHQAPARAGQGAGRADRGRPDPGRRPDARPRCRSIGDAKEALRGAAAAAERRTTTAPTWRSTRSRWTTGGRTWPRSRRRPRTRSRRSTWSAARRAGRRRRDPDLRLRHDRHLGRAALDDPRRPRVLPVGQPRHDGARPAVRDRHAARVPGPAGHRVRRRRRVRDAHGRVPHRRPAPAAGQGRRQQQRLARPDPVGADGARLPRVRRAVPEPPPDFAAWARPAAGYGAKVTQARRPARRDPRGAGLRRARRWSTSTSTRTSRRCPARSPTSRRRSSPRRSCKGQPHKAAIATTLFKDKIQQLKG